MTVTFKKNRDKRLCAESWNLFRSYLNKKSVRKRFFLPDNALKYFAVWEQHKSGGWHLHLIGHLRGVSTSKIRRCIRHFLGVTRSAVGFIHVIWTKGHDGNGISYYMSKYLSKEDRIAGIRYVNYSRNWIRSVKGPFSFLAGLSRSWRETCYHISANFRGFKRLYKELCENDFDTLLDIVSNFRLGDYEAFMIAWITWIEKYYRSYKLLLQKFKRELDYDFRVMVFNRVESHKYFSDTELPQVQGYIKIA
jgi:hypothetical protein